MSLSSAPAWSLGPVPSWVELGPLEEIDGMSVRKVLGDWSHMHECDRPPQYLREGYIYEPNPNFSMAEDRDSIPQRLPGKHISGLRGVHSGACAIFFNGESLAQHDLYRIQVPTIGMNRTHSGFAGYKGPQPDYLCVIDELWIKDRNVLAHPCLIDGSISGRDNGGYRATRHFRGQPFSFDLARDGYCCPVPCTTGHLALQLAVWMGFTEIFCLGWDMSGGHFDGTGSSMHFQLAKKYHLSQAQILADHGIKVWVCGSPESKVVGYEHCDFEALVGKERAVA
jgi:hypothetical protein